MEFKYININDAYADMIARFMSAKQSFDYKAPEITTYGKFSRSPSRYGDVIYINEPVTITYTNPSQRVLFHQGRDANPFFHHMEALWMLAGRRDVDFVSKFSSQIGKFSDDGKTFYGAYGHRWRHGATDQIKAAIKCLRADPYSRRVVITMYHPSDLWKVEMDTANGQPHLSKDIPCNTSIMLQIDNPVIERSEGQQASLTGGHLNMTVINRSNDLVLGCLGANMVHMSMLQEYIACSLGIDMGVYRHVTNNLHLYTDTVKSEWTTHDRRSNIPDISSYPLFNTPAEKHNFDIGLSDLDGMLVLPSSLWNQYPSSYHRHVTLPMMGAWTAYKNGDYRIASASVRKIGAPDWKLACLEWLQRRFDKKGITL